MSSNTGENRNTPFFFSQKKKVEDEAVEHNNCEFLEECDQKITKFYFTGLCINQEGRGACRVYAKKIEKITNVPALRVPSVWLSIIVSEEQQKKQQEASSR